MPRVCSICSHKERAEIDKALIDSVPFRHIASRYNVTTGSLQRHKADHLPAAMVQSKQAAEVARGDTLLDQVKSLQEKALAILATAEKDGQLRTALMAIREARENLTLLGKLMGELQENQINIVMAPEWVVLRTVIMQALEPYPEARLSLIPAIVEVEREFSK